ncbi:NADP-dependent malic enzyme [Corynebacterium sp. MC-18]|uniref:NADP-dependent malic enzyme n=2 Tax=Corynebacteriaceae TaxID=1653 RepID=A0AAW5HZJ0_9CORY|nr:NADP-dependent malic enzyme [Corynebacterium lipophilum]
MEVSSMRDLAICYTPGVAEVCEAIAQDPAQARRYTGAGNTVAVITDGTAVLGLGDIGPQASLPVMEGKAQLFQQFAGLNSFPIVLDTQDVDEIVDTVVRIAPSFAAINLEDIAAPRCFDIERRLDERLNIPVMHDDQHGTAVVIYAALRNAARVLGRTLADLRVVISGAGAAGIACVDMLLDAGIRDIIVLDSQGPIHADRVGLSPVKQSLAARTNPRNIHTTVDDALRDADTFIGLSRGHITEEQVLLMSEAPILFSLANPTPEIEPEVARRHGGVVATGRSDMPNQINNVLAFPGIFRGAIDAGATRITRPMLLAASEAIASLIDAPTAHNIVPQALDPRVAPAVAKAVADAV